MTWMGWAAIILPCTGLIGAVYLWVHLWERQNSHDRKG